MIKRIKQIENIGRFARHGNCEFAQVTLVFGYNGHGKSTLADILRSLANNDASILKKRATIASDGSQQVGAQSVAFTYVDSAGESEKDLQFNNGTWNKNGFPYEIEIFDSRFIEENVFTGMGILRSNKEKLTDLILGTGNVEVAKEIGGLNHGRSKITKAYGEVSDSIKKSLGLLNLGVTLDEFVKTEQISDSADIAAKILELNKDKDKLQKTLEGLDEIIQLTEPGHVESLPDIKTCIDLITALLGSNFNDTEKDVLKKFENHIGEHFKEHDGRESDWLKKGVVSYADFTNLASKCPFCGQLLSHAGGLMGTYSAIFSDAFRSYYEKLQNDLRASFSECKRFDRTLEYLNQSIKNNLVATLKFKDHLDKPSTEKIKLVEDITVKLETHLGAFKNSLEAITEKLSSLVEEKYTKPLETLKFEYLDIAGLFVSLLALQELLNEYGNSITVILTAIQSYKGGLSTPQIETKIQAIDTELRGLAVKQKRYEFGAQIDQLKILQLQKDDIQLKIKEKQQELESKNDSFIQTYFEEVSHLFNSFGAEGYKLEKVLSYKGNQPVYSFSLKFNGKELSEDLIPYILSDADRRSLALSLFVAKLRAKAKNTNNGLQNTIIILDDPVTSFDSDRTTKTVNVIRELIPVSRQLVVLSHYREFLKAAYGRIKDLSVVFALLKIERGVNGCSLTAIGDMSIEFDSYAKSIDEIEHFIAGDDANFESIRMKLRVILQEEMEWRFRIQLKGVSYTGVGGLVEHLRLNHGITEARATKLQSTIQSLQDEHHHVADDTPQDVRNTAKEVMKLIFLDLNSGSLIQIQ